LSVHYLESKVASRYFTHGNLNQKTQFIWLVCHGYGQLSKYFIKKFEILNPEQHFVIAPEGMNRFYLDGFSGRVGATWMTKEDREKDIVNYCKQLNQIEELFIHKLAKETQTIFLGFSQGAATISRWMSVEQKSCDRLYLWAGKMAHELKAQEFNPLFKKAELIFGDQDQFYSEEQALNYAQNLAENGFEIDLVKYKGEHNINQLQLLKITESL